MDEICSWCHWDTYTKNNTLVPVCVNCGNDIKGFIFHRHCIYIIYDQKLQNIGENFQQKLNIIKCMNCLCEKFDPDVII